MRVGYPESEELDKPIKATVSLFKTKIRYFTLLLVVPPKTERGTENDQYELECEHSV